MAVSGNPYATLRKALEKTAKDQAQRTASMAKSVKALIKEQFSTGTDPYGRAQKVRADGEPGGYSKHLPNAIKVTATANGVEGIGILKDKPRKTAAGKKTSVAKRQWLDAMQKGHTFAARQGGGHRMFFDAAGRAIGKSRSKASLGNKYKISVKHHGSNKARVLGLKLKKTKSVTVGERETFWQQLRGESRRRGHATRVRLHYIRQRVLPARPIYPDDGIGSRWSKRIADDFAEVLAKQLEKSLKR